MLCFPYCIECLNEFVPSKPVVTNDVFKVEIHYSGLGGADSLVIKQNFKAKQATISAMAFPNPVLENTMIQIDADSDFIYEFTLFNNFGKQISTYTTTSKSKIVNLNLTQILPFHKAESSSIYILRINAISKDGKILESKTLKLEKL